MLAFFVTYFGRLVVSPVIPFILDDFNVSNMQVGIALSGMWIAYGVTQFPRLDVDCLSDIDRQNWSGDRQRILAFPSLIAVSAVELDGISDGQMILGLGTSTRR